jgi:Subtilase family
MDCVPGHPVFTDWCGHGQLIVASPPNPMGDELGAYLEEQQSRLGFLHLYSLVGYLAQREVRIDPRFATVFPRYHLIETPLPNIFDVINGLYRGLGDRAGVVGIIEPNQQLSVLAPQVRVGTNFDLYAAASSHKTYKSQLNAMGPTTRIGGNHIPVDGSGVKIAIIDTGLEAGKSAASYSDFVVPQAAQDDSDGHGTAMFEIIKDIAPGAELHIYRVTHSTTVFVWDLMAAVCAAVYSRNADVVSLSMGCKNLSYPCKLCGGHGANRSAVCQQFFDLLDKHSPDPKLQSIVVAAVGNDGPKDPFDWPAAYDSVLAVGSVNGAGRLSSFSNSATATSPKTLCLLPGGDETATGREYVGQGLDSAAATYCFGTSPATAYAAGVLALRKHSDLLRGVAWDKVKFMDRLVATANASVMDAHNYDIYDPAVHGMGRLDYSP